MVEKGRPLEATSPVCGQAWVRGLEISDTQELVISSYRPGPCGGKDVPWVCVPGIPGSSPSPGSSRCKLRQNHGRSGGDLRVLVPGLPVDRASWLGPGAAQGGELPRCLCSQVRIFWIIDICRASWSLDGIWNNEIMTTLAHSDRRWMNATPGCC